ncbi:ATP-binding protein [Streptomyces xiangluensis]|uniref:ATP-binding protein n=1 Tax=Streptomyces xiangluensis TaxID=2665720 RepID=A0ABV8YF91_9ACTN
MALNDATTTTGDTPPPDLGTTTRCAAFTLPADGRAVAEARHLVREQLSNWGTDPDGCDTAALVVSELFTNAVVHTSSQAIACNVEATPDQLLIQVTDDGSGPSTPMPQRANTHDEDGRGLLLVKAVSERWGVGPAEDGDARNVWATVRTNRA